MRFNDQLSMPSVHSALYSLRGTGPDGVFDTADDTLTELDATYEAINSTFNSILNLYSRGVVDSGRYRIEADLIDVAGHDVRLFEPVTVSGSVAEANLFTDAALTSPGLTGSYVNQSLRTVNELDWRATQQISGTRVDPKVRSSALNLASARPWELPADPATTIGTISLSSGMDMSLYPRTEFSC